MGKCKNATKGGSDAQKGVSPTLSSFAGEAGDTGDVLQDLMDEVASLKEALSQMGASSKMPIHFARCGRSPYDWSLSPEHQQCDPAHEDWMCYCIQVRVTLWEAGGDQPPPSHTWTSFINCQHVPGWPYRRITEAVVLASGEAILFFRWLLQEGLPLGDARDVGFCLASTVNWSGRGAQVETMVSTVQEGNGAIADAIMGKEY